MYSNGWDVPGGKIQRYGDIWGGYFLQALMRGTEYHVAFGRPIVDHRRNPHDYVDDLRSEYWGMILTDWLVEKLRSGFFPKDKEMIGRVEELADFIRSEAYHDIPIWCPHEVKDFFSGQRITCVPGQRHVKRSFEIVERSNQNKGMKFKSYCLSSCSSYCLYYFSPPRACRAKIHNVRNDSDIAPDPTLWLGFEYVIGTSTQFRFRSIKRILFEKNALCYVHPA